MVQKKKDPWGSTSGSPFSATHNAGTGPTAGAAIFEDEIGWDPGTMGNRRGWKNGVWYDNSGGGGGDDSFEGNSARDPNRGRPGYVQAEDGSWVPADYWDKAKGKTSQNAKTGKPIEW